MNPNDARLNAPYICTLTGADDTIQHNELFHLSAKFPFVEWGILHHATLQGQGRYPSFRWIDILCTQIPVHTHTRFALHVCGRDAVNEFLTGTGSTRLRAARFARVQINFLATRYDPALVVTAIQRNRGKMIITQHNEANEGLLPMLSRIPNHAILFDASGGHGVSPSTWPTHVPNKACGYAGGLGPDNLSRELPRIQQAAGQHPYWIDMEGKLRDEADRFDLARARLCLETCRQFMRS